MVSITIPGVRLENPLNSRQHWRIVASRGRKEKRVARMVLGPVPAPDLPASVTLTRVAPRAFDSDGLAASCKHIRDAVAEWLGVDDADGRLSWQYQQERSNVPNFYAVRITVQPQTQTHKDPP